MKKTYRGIAWLVCFQLFVLAGLSAQSIIINVDATSEKKPISPYLYGKNNSLSDKVFGADPLSAQEWQYLKDLGIQMFRENGGNNSTKYNWRRKLSSHPDWYNNVYSHDWDYAASSLQANIPSAQGMWAFQLIGKAAKTGNHNFNDWVYNGSKWWEGVHQNLAGGGVVNPDKNGDALVEGNPSLYLEDWNADSTTGILEHWFGTNGIGLDSDRIRYWNMDNEPEIWNGTHDDVWPEQPTAEEFMQMYFAVAKKARSLFPGIKLLGPVPANEWQWYNWKGGSISYNGKNYPWLEYFILRVAEEQQATGIRLLDVLDIHFYPGETSPTDIVQLHRVYFDTTYNYPGANGVHRLGSSGWDNSITKEYIFKRCSDWLKKYMGSDHGVTFSVTETAIAKKDEPSLTANWYASTLGEFARNGVEIFTPWDWVTGMSEVVHLFSHYGEKNILPATSSNEYYVSAYPTINHGGDSMTVFLVNRHLYDSKNVRLNLEDFVIDDGTYKLYTLADLPAGETFISHTSNALELKNVAVSNNEINVTLEPLSVSALILVKSETPFGELLTYAEAESGTLSGVTTGNTDPGYSGSGYVTDFNATGDRVTVTVNVPSKDVYRIVIVYNGSGENTHQVSINNSYKSQLTFPETDVFGSVEAGGFLLNSGINTISISNISGTLQPDKIEIYRMPVNDFNISSSLIDPQANQAAKDLYSYLQSQFGEHIISGQTHDYYGELKAVAGKSPMLRAGDFQHFTQGYPYLWSNEKNGHIYGYDGNDETVTSLINWYNNTGKKGIVSMHWHWHDPLGDSTSNVNTNTFYTDETSFDIRRAVIPGTIEYNCVIRDIDSIATQLKKFEAAGVPVLWRPLHEAGGGWFWWGAYGAEPCLALWDILIDRLKNHHQIHNLIWVWSSPEYNWFPGNDKVDMIGYDSYPGSFNYTNQKSMFDNLYTITRGEKLIAMTENGPIPDPDVCIEGDATWLYFMSWSDLVTSQNSDAHIINVYNNPIVLTLDSFDPPKYNVTFKVLRDLTFEPLNGCPVVFNGESNGTNASGEVSFTVDPGTYDYLVARTSYESEEGTLEIFSDTSITVLLLQTHANIRIRLREENRPVTDAEIVLNEDTRISNSLGDALFSKLPVAQSYNYKVIKDGYEEITGDVSLSTDTTVLLQMTKVIVSADKGLTDEAFSVWPNPADDYIRFTIPGENTVNQILITGINGTTISRKPEGNKPYQVNLHGIPQGIYLLQVICNEAVYKAVFSRQ